MTEETAAYGSYDEFLRHKFAAYSHDDMRKLTKEMAPGSAEHRHVMAEIDRRKERER